MMILKSDAEDSNTSADSGESAACFDNVGCADFDAYQVKGGKCCPREDGIYETCCTFDPPEDTQNTSTYFESDPSAGDEPGFLGPLQNTLCEVQAGDVSETREDLEACSGRCAGAADCQAFSFDVSSERCLAIRTQRCQKITRDLKFVTYVKNSWHITSTWLPPMKAKANSLHLFALGDWGSLTVPGRASMHYAHRARKDPKLWEWQVDHNAQENVARVMTQRAEKTENLMAVVNIGDSFYWAGIPNANLTGWGIHDKNWKKGFEAVYTSEHLMVPWLSVLGNHDYGGDRCLSDTEAQIQYTWKDLLNNSRWKMPGKFYRQRIDTPRYSVEIFMLDTNILDSMSGRGPKGGGICNQLDCDARDRPKAYRDPKECFRNFTILWGKQKVWLERALASSTAKWKIVAGHHKANPGQYGDWIHELAKRYGIQLIIGGHTHESSFQEPSSKRTSVLVVGQGGGAQAKPGCGGQYFCGGLNDYSFADLEISERNLKVSFHRGYDGAQLRATNGKDVFLVNSLGQLGGEWVVSPWGRCTDGLRERHVQCSAEVEDCFHERPNASRSCGWLVGQWGECTASGLRGLRRRSRTCLEGEGQCRDLEEPATEEKCFATETVILPALVLLAACGAVLCSTRFKRQGARDSTVETELQAVH
eukprot:TRINITY_DN22341_c0_g2_i1.p1 TRINITY_DN22341_c0_g2~~TRINITY_DN22341_c0_g2_i1.p1  ORF type:complete len:716 (-),score=115.71 TRINITY_DN22341_c0_g2_i1:38-1981(-)